MELLAELAKRRTSHELGQPAGEEQASALPQAFHRSAIDSPIGDYDQTHGRVVFKLNPTEAIERKSRNGTFGSQ